MIYKNGQVIYEPFFVEDDFGTAITGLVVGDFSFAFTVDGVTDAGNGSLAFGEIGSGWYYFTWTPAVVGGHAVRVDYTAGKLHWVATWVVVDNDNDDLAAAIGEITRMPVTLTPFQGAVSYSGSFPVSGAVVHIVRGDSPAIPYVITDGEGNVVDLTGKDVFFAAKAESGGAYAIAVSDQTANVTDAANGVGFIKLEITDTDIEPGTYKGEIELRYGVDQILTVAQWDIVIDEAVITS